MFRDRIEAAGLLASALAQYRGQSPLVLAIPRGAVPMEEAGKPAKLVRDSFTMPADDFALVGVMKARALQAQRPAKKSELLRAGLHALSAREAEILETLLLTFFPGAEGMPPADLEFLMPRIDAFLTQNDPDTRSLFRAIPVSPKLRYLVSRTPARYPFDCF
jgi:hypothetical protein